MIKRIMLSLALLVSLVIMTGCGTETGNPASPNNGSGRSPVVDERLMSVLILDSICEALTRCHASLTLQHCYNLGLKQKQLGPSLGLDPDEFGIYSEIVFAEYKRTITANQTAGLRCVSEIIALDCSTDAVNGAYDAESDKLGELSPLLGPICRGVF